MRQNTRVTFAMRDLDRLKCIQAVVDRDLKPHRTAERLGLTSRQVRRLARRYAAASPVGLISCGAFRLLSAYGSHANSGRRRFNNPD
jgi:hypothetical protein